ncbi:extracellular solute-binding protein [Natrinema hispanicum]|uniref:Molybdate/tungstate transport system substrate-binding protein n=1 Tax=Natrinema hispanicum TaxID=392421 RepID=A0A1I0I6K3_9EURY|nr:extracellular solute-binding protein [Natrinema hispanicum]SDD67230.1 molybdate/tungstate transport system substrate-binding protein [Natrinema hispanicum]SET92317.1 molybdate/tungstate transport system substrate-binding protein [Natrinema hispanicum]
MAGDGLRTRRRSVLSATAVALSGVAGCSGTLQGPDGQSVPVSMLAAGSLNNALENGLRPSVAATVQIEAHGSAEVARLIAAGQKDPDIVSVADIALFDSPLQPAWFAEFATNSIVIAYNPDTEGGQQLADAGTESWYQPLLNGDITIGRTDPDLDPLGYRALFMLELATTHYGTDANLRDAIPRTEQIYPETQLISQFETGSVDAAIAYRNMAVERGYDYIDLPVEIDLSDPSYTDTYESATYELPSGKVVSGGLISYGATIRNQSPAAVDVFTEHITGEYLNEFGFVVPDDYPRFTGNAPDEVTN